MQDLYRGHSRDAGDTMMLAFEAGTYTQVPGASSFSPPPLAVFSPRVVMLSLPSVSKSDCNAL